MRIESYTLMLSIYRIRSYSSRSESRLTLRGSTHLQDRTEHRWFWSYQATDLPESTVFLAQWGASSRSHPVANWKYRCPDVYTATESRLLFQVALWCGLDGARRTDTGFCWRNPGAGFLSQMRPARQSLFAGCCSLWRGARKYASLTLSAWP